MKFFNHVFIGGGVGSLITLESAIFSFLDKLSSQNCLPSRRPNYRINFAIVDKDPENIPGGVGYGYKTSRFGYFNNPLRLSPPTFVNWVLKPKNRPLIIEYLEKYGGITGKEWNDKHGVHLLEGDQASLAELYLPRAILCRWLEEKLIRLFDVIANIRRNYNVEIGLQFFSGEVTGLRKIGKSYKELEFRHGVAEELKMVITGEQFPMIQFKTTRTFSNFVLVSEKQSLCLGLMPPRQIATDRAQQSTNYLWDFYAEGGTNRLLQLLEKKASNRHSVSVAFVGYKAGLLEPLNELYNIILLRGLKIAIHSFSKSLDTIESADLSRGLPRYELKFLNEQSIAEIDSPDQLLACLVSEFEHSVKSGYKKYDAWTEVLSTGVLSSYMEGLSENHIHNYYQEVYPKIRSLTRFTYPKTLQIKSELESRGYLRAIKESVKFIDLVGNRFLVSTVDQGEDESTYQFDIVVNVSGPVTVDSAEEAVPIVKSLVVAGVELDKAGIPVNSDFEIESLPGTYLPGTIAMGYNPLRKTIITAILENGMRAGQSISKCTYSRLCSPQSYNTSSIPFLDRLEHQGSCSNRTFGGISGETDFLEMVLAGREKNSLFEKSLRMSCLPYSICITIDGKAGAGKTTLAIKLSEFFGLVHIDTGYIFKAVAKRLNDERIEISEVNRHKILKTMAEIDIYSLADMELNNGEFSLAASILASFPFVRKNFDLKTREICLGLYATVVTGRDTGAKAFANESDVYRIFLQVSDNVAAERKENMTEAKSNAGIETRKRNKKDVRNIVVPENSFIINTDDYSAGTIFEKTLELII